MNARHILLLEDEAIIAMDMELTLKSNGFEVMGPCRSVQQALEMLDTKRPDVAVLDVNLGRNQTSVSLAERLSRMGIPVVFLSGYSESVVQLPEALKFAPRLSKPVVETDLLSAIARAASG